MRLPFFLVVAIGAKLSASVPIVFNKEPDPPVQFHDGIYKFGWDIDLSPFAGGEDLLFVHRALERAEGYFVGKSPVYYSKQAAARIWRLGELFMGWLPVNYLATVLQHEIFGHGYRIRDINHGKAKVDGYHIGVPLPYGNGGGSTSYSVSAKLTTTQETSIAMAGVESTAILAQTTKLKWLEANWIDPRQSILYLLCQHDLDLYIGSLKSQGSLSGHDISEYVHSVNYTYPASLIKSSWLQSIAWINLADPFTYYALFSWFHYVSSGKETKIPMIRIWDWGYLPTVRLGLTPFGPEFFLENYLLKGNRPVYFYGKGSQHAGNGYYGVGFFAPKIWNFGRWSLGSRVDGWWQPQLLLFPGRLNIFQIDFDTPPDPNDPLYPYSQQHKMSWGGAASILVAYQAKRSGFEVELGGKSKGFLPGYSLVASPVARIYYALKF